MDYVYFMSTCVDKEAITFKSPKFKGDGMNAYFRTDSYGYAAIVPFKDEFIVGGCDYKNRFDLQRKVVNEMVDTKLYAAPVIQSLPNIRYKDNIYLIGESAGYVDFITCEGISFALNSGIKIADVISNDLGNVGYVKLFKEEVGRAKNGRLFSSILFNKHTLNMVKKHYYKNYQVIDYAYRNLIITHKYKYWKFGKFTIKMLFNKLLDMLSR